MPRLRSLQHQLQVPQGTLSSSFPRALGLRQLLPTIPLASAGALWEDSGVPWLWWPAFLDPLLGSWALPSPLGPVAGMCGSTEIHEA